MQASRTTMGGCDSQADQFDHAATAARELMRKVPLVGEYSGIPTLSFLLTPWILVPASAPSH